MDLMTTVHFETDSRGLEQFLFQHDIRFYATHTGPWGRTVWVYHRTGELERVVEEWRTIIARRNSTGRKQYGI